MENTHKNGFLYNVIESIGSFAEDKIGVMVVWGMIHYFLIGFLGAVPDRGSDGVLTFVYALFRFPGTLYEILLAIAFVSILLYCAVEDIVSETNQHLLLKAMLGILIFCFCMIVLVRIGSAVAGNLLYVVIIGLLLLLGGSVGVTVVSSAGVELFSTFAGALPVFAEGAAAIMTYVAIVTAISVIVDTIASFF